jgi:hypothetical protein
MNPKEVSHIPFDLYTIEQSLVHFNSDQVTEFEYKQEDSSVNTADPILNFM